MQMPLRGLSSVSISVFLFGFRGEVGTMLYKFMLQVANVL